MSRAATTLSAFLAHVVHEFGPREALVGQRHRLTYAALGAMADRVAGSLAARGVERGSRVGLLLPNAPEWIAIAFGVWRAGGAIVPISTLYRARELAHALQCARVTHLIAARRFLHHDYERLIGEIAMPKDVLADVAWLDAAEPGPIDLSPLGSGALPPDVTTPDDEATVYFTSGTTAEPKGVVHRHRAVCAAAEDIATVLGLDATDRTWGYLPFFFTGGLFAVALGTMARGGAVVVQDRFDAGETLRLLEAERCSVFFAWPHQVEALLAHPRFPTTRLMLRKGVGANTKWADAIYPPDHQAVGTYGMTETAPLCTAWPFDASLALRRSSHGPPVGEKVVRIVDPDTGRMVEPEVTGEICVRGPTLFSHYDGRRPEECVDAEGFFHTGDLGRLDASGALHFLGRIKDVIKTAGVNVAAAEVESVLLSHPGVAVAHVVGVPDAQRGENVAAFVVVSAPQTPDDIVGYCRAHLATYKVPRHVWIVTESELPTKSSGKVDKAVLRDRAVAALAARDASARS